MKKVTAAIIQVNGSILLARRKPGEKLAGYWEFPGGKVEDGESLQQALEREIREELEVEIMAGEVVTSSIYTYKHGAIKLIALTAEVISGNIRLNVHDKVEWVRTQGLLDYKLAPADIPIAKELINYDWRN
ncbi:(deoxy)nucleoside triphosphate pyrophosphohydrolase [Desulfosediminicola ganghwensis]|uniref:(deoxy)nucleoside triphosphate pyrophosphohydrolase n=1 Tax=Desulfosediminicola ganghwensis TaxID=2569540 RepID=UPI0010AC5CCC|nr:NUDIX domain-containing protein [Desulfosediminicola ganghwensis]